MYRAIDNCQSGFFINWQSCYLINEVIGQLSNLPITWEYEQGRHDQAKRRSVRPV